MTDVNVTGEIYNMLLASLHITFTPDTATEKRIRNEAAAGIEFIRRYCDPEAVCDPESFYGQLLCEYVLRAEAGDSQAFAKDFACEITSLKAEYDAKIYAEANGYA